LLEDNFFKGEHSPSLNDGHPLILIAANASGGLRRESGLQYCIPGWAELKAMLRIMLIQNLNTVGPRVDNLERTVQRDWVEDNAPSHLSPMTIPIGISQAPETLLKGWYSFFVTNQPKVLFSRLEWHWATKTLSDIETMLQKDAGDQKNELLTQIDHSLRNKPHPRIDEERRRIEDLETRGFRELCEMAEGELEAVPTNLDRIPRQTAIALIARGYVNTLAMAYVFRLVELDHEMFARLTRERLELLTS